MADDTRTQLVEIATKRGTEDPVKWADATLQRWEDEADLRALGYCLSCKQPITLRQVGRCVYSEPCGHHRAQGELKRMQPFIRRRREAMTVERRQQLLALCGGAASDGTQFGTQSSPETPTAPESAAEVTSR